MIPLNIWLICKKIKLLFIYLCVFLTVFTLVSWFRNFSNSRKWGSIHLNNAFPCFFHTSCLLIEKNTEGGKNTMKLLDSPFQKLRKIFSLPKRMGLKLCSSVDHNPLSNLRCLLETNDNRYPDFFSNLSGMLC